eukprot:49330_1
MESDNEKIKVDHIDDGRRTNIIELPSSAKITDEKNETKDDRTTSISKSPDEENKTTTLNMMIPKWFTAPTAADYIACKRDIENCNAMKRVFHLLEYYKTTQRDNNISPIYKYLESLKDYAISDVMEDWHHCKIQHFINEQNNYPFKNNEAINCKNNENCIYVLRNQRDRIRQTSDICSQEIDYKNIILMDKLDSIHAYIFHYPSLKITSINDNIWSNYPNVISDCNTEQIIHILTNENIFDNKISDHKLKIIEYINENELDGAALVDMKRKPFLNQLAKYLSNKKLKLSLGKLYKEIINFDICKYTIDEKRNIWSNNPTCIKDCTIQQIIHILTH